MIVMFAGTAIVLLSAAWIDVRKQRIPNILVIFLLVFQFFTIFLFNLLLKTPVFTLPDIYDRIKASVLVLVCFYPFYAIGELGAGDVKLMAVAVFSAVNPQIFILSIFIIGIVLGLFKYIFKQNKHDNKRIVIQMALPIFLAFIFSEVIWRG